MKDFKMHTECHILVLERKFVTCRVSGIVGDWKNLLTVAEAEHFDAVYKDNMKDVKYKFAWD